MSYHIYGLFDGSSCIYGSDKKADRSQKDPRI